MRSVRHCYLGDRRSLQFKKGSTIKFVSTPLRRAINGLKGGGAASLDAWLGRSSHLDMDLERA